MHTSKYDEQLAEEYLRHLVDKFSQETLILSSTSSSGGIDPLWARFKRAAINQISGGDATRLGMRFGPTRYVITSLLRWSAWGKGIAAAQKNSSFEQQIASRLSLNFKRIWTRTRSRNIIGDLRQPEWRNENNPNLTFLAAYISKQRGSAR